MILRLIIFCFITFSFQPLMAQFRLDAEGGLVFDRDIDFNNAIFHKNKDVRVNYTFKSYRLTYRYDFIANERWRIGAGLTGKIRDAVVRYRNASNQQHFSNVGFVPLVRHDTFMRTRS